MKSNLLLSLLQLKLKILLASTFILFFCSVLNAQPNTLNQNVDSLLSLPNQQNLTVKPEEGFPVVGVTNDVLFYIFQKVGAFKPQDRAENISKKIQKLADNDFVNFDSIKTVVSENNIDIVLGETIIMSVSNADALSNNISLQVLANQYSEKIKNELITARKEGSILRLLTRVGLVVLVLGGTWFVFILIIRGFRKLEYIIKNRKGKWLKDLTFRDYTFLTVEQELSALLFLIKIIRWFVFVFLLYFALPLIFSIFPFTRGWADVLLGLIWSPFKGVLLSVWKYMPNLFSILVIVVVMRYFIRFVKYIFLEIKHEHLSIPGFHSDWAMPTFGIVRFLLLAFMFVLIFPKLPGSDSDIFKGVSVFIGILFSLGSSSAIANMVAGLVITYMRPFKLGDRIKIGGVTGDVVEKTMLVTRLKTVKNEVITIPNSTVLSGNTTNYSSIAENEGLIIYSTVTIGYDVPWKNVHEALIDAAFKTEFLLKDPKPFVLQTSLDDFYVSYQINAFTKEAKKQAVIYSTLHQNIQDVCNERGIEIMSPHYRAARDGNSSTIPPGFLPTDYKSPGFNVHITEKE